MLLKLPYARGHDYHQHIWIQMGQAEAAYLKLGWSSEYQEKPVNHGEYEVVKIQVYCSEWEEMRERWENRSAPLSRAWNKRKWLWKIWTKTLIWPSSKDWTTLSITSKSSWGKVFSFFFFMVQTLSNFPSEPIHKCHNEEIYVISRCSSAAEDLPGFGNFIWKIKILGAALEVFTLSLS